MNGPWLPPSDFLPLLPAIFLSLGAMLLLLSEVFLSTSSRQYQSAIALVASAAAGFAAVNLLAEPPREVLQGFGVLDPFSSFLTATVCVALFLVVLTATSFLHAREAERGEFYALVLFGGAGMSLLSLSGELITVFINLEILSVATYALAAYLRKGQRPAEAGFKYFILGAFSTAVFLYGTALLYGATHTTRLSALATAIGPALRQNPGLVYVGASLIAAGLAFKVAAVPFHMWTPDVYEGSPTPVTALMSAGVKAAAFAALVRVFLSIGRGMDPRFPEVLFATLALLTMVGGNLLALPQRNVKRMLAYSSVAHAGYVLLGVTSLFARPSTEVPGVLAAKPLIPGVLAATQAQADALRGILFYLLAYTVTAVGAFATLSALERREDEDRGTAWDLERFAGLVQRRPGWAIAMAVFMLSLGGIPPTAGFFGKLLIFRSAVDTGLVSLAVIGVLASAAGAYYYLRVVVYMFMRPAPEGAALPERHWGLDTALVLSTAAVVVLGVAPGVLSGWLDQASSIFGR